MRVGHKCYIARKGVGPTLHLLSTKYRLPETTRAADHLVRQKLTIKG